MGRKKFRFNLIKTNLMFAEFSFTVMSDSIELSLYKRSWCFCWRRMYPCQDV